jgi:hypothetical protein
MKQTDEDARFAQRFARELQPHIASDRDGGKSWAEIAKALGVTAPGLQKQLAGGTPSIRTIALAYDRYKVSVPYEGIEIAKALATKRSKRKTGRPYENQLLLPFDITAPAFSRGIRLKRMPQGVRRYRLQLLIAR